MTVPKNNSSPSTPYIEEGIHSDLCAFITSIPWHQILGLEVLELSTGRAKLRIPNTPHLVGNKSWGVIHGGVIAALADSCGNAALWTHFGPDDRTATIDLRVDFFRPAPSNFALIAESEVKLLGNRIGNIHVTITSESDRSITIAEGRTVCYIAR